MLDRENKSIVINDRMGKTTLTTRADKTSILRIRLLSSGELETYSRCHGTVWEADKTICPKLANALGEHLRKRQLTCYYYINQWDFSQLDRRYRACKN